MQGLEGDLKKGQEKRAPQPQAGQMNNQDPAVNQQQKTELKVTPLPPKKKPLWEDTVDSVGGRDVKLHYQSLLLG